MMPATALLFTVKSLHLQAALYDLANRIDDESAMHRAVLKILEISRLSESYGLKWFEILIELHEQHPKSYNTINEIFNQMGDPDDTFPDVKLL